MLFVYYKRMIQKSDIFRARGGAKECQINSDEYRHGQLFALIALICSNDFG